MTQQEEETLRAKVFAMELITAQVLALIAFGIEKESRELWMASIGIPLEERFNRLPTDTAKRAALETYEVITSCALRSANDMDKSKPDAGEES